MLRTKRAYEPASPDDGVRILVDRLWPRGLSKEEARLTAWDREIAPSDGLRRWFAHDPDRYDSFRSRYRAELAAHRPRLVGLANESRRGAVTLVYAAKDGRHNNAAVLQELLEEILR